MKDDIYYRNKRDYFLMSSLPVDVSKLDGVAVIHDLEQAEREFRDINGFDEDEDVFIPSIMEIDGVVVAESVNAFICPIECSIETFINEFDI